MKKLPRLGIVIVSYGHEEYVLKSIQRLRKQMSSNDQIALIDNKSGGGLRDQARESVDYFDELPNPGFAAAVNHGARAIQDDVDILFIINPDALPSENVVDAVKSGYGKGYAAWMTLLVLPDGAVNSAGNVVHMSGLSWCDGYLSSPADYSHIQEIYDLSGACMAFDAEWWARLGGMDESYFLYYEDTDISARIKLQGGKMALAPQGSVEHHYDFGKGTYKWFYLERNRYLYIIKTWPLGVIATLFPVLIASEIGLWAIAILEKRFTLRVKSVVSLFSKLPNAIRERRQLQSDRKISSYDYLKTITYKLDSPLLGRLSKNKLIEGLFLSYYRIALGILKPFK